MVRERGEVVGVRHRPGRALGRTRHRLIEGGGGLGVRGQVFEEGRPEEVIEGGLAGAHAVEQAAPRPCTSPRRSGSPWPAALRGSRSRGSARGSSSRTRRPRSPRTRRGRPGPASAGTATAHASGWPAPSASMLLGAILQQVGDAELRRHVDDLRGPVPVGHLLQGGLGLCNVSASGLARLAHSPTPPRRSKGGSPSIATMRPTEPPVNPEEVRLGVRACSRMSKQYRVILSERRAGGARDSGSPRASGPARDLAHARILLKADEGPAARPGPTPPSPTALDVSRSTVERVRKRFVRAGAGGGAPAPADLAGSIGASWTASRRPTWSPWPARRHPSGDGAGRCGCWPTSWSSCGTSTASRTRRCARCSRRTAQALADEALVHPARAERRVRWRMEDVLEVYTRPYDPKRPQVCLDEASKQLLSRARPPRTADAGRAAPGGLRVRAQRDGQPVPGHASRSGAGATSTVTERRTRLDWARVIKDLVDVHYPEAERIVLVHGQPEHPHARLALRGVPAGRGAAAGRQAWRSTTRPSTGAG